MNQVDRRQREQLCAEELALLKSCGSAIRKTDQEALALARIKGVGNLTSADRIFKAVRTLIARRNRGVNKADLAHDGAGFTSNRLTVSEAKSPSLPVNSAERCA